MTDTEKFEYEAATHDLRAEVERLERVRLQNENLIQHQSLKMDQFADKVKRLEAAAKEQT